MDYTMIETRAFEDLQNLAGQLLVRVNQYRELTNVPSPDR